MKLQLFKWPILLSLDSIKLFFLNWLKLFYCLFPISVFINPSKGGTSNFFYLGILTPWLALVCLRQLKGMPHHRLLISSIILFGYLWLTCWWSEYNTALEVLTLAKWFVYAICMLTTPYILSRSNPRIYLLLLPIIFCSAIVSAVFAISEHINTYGGHVLQHRMWGFGYSYNPIALAINNGTAVLVSFYLLQYFPKYRWPIIALTFIPLIAMLMSNSRGPILFLILSSDLYLLTHHRHKDLFIFKVMLLFVITFVYMAIGWEGLVTHRGFSHRPEIWQQSLEWFRQSPLFGEGFSQHADRIALESETVSHSHNVLLEVMRYGGLMGLVFLLWQWREIYRTYINLLYTPYLIYGVILCFSLLCMMINGWFLLDRPNYFWLSYWYPLGALIAALNQKKLKVS